VPHNQVDGDQLKAVTEKNVDKPVKLTVYNSKNQDVRELTMIPNNTWGGKGLLGLSIRYVVLVVLGVLVAFFMFEVWM
jgi:hypothetical protein